VDLLVFFFTKILCFYDSLELHFTCIVHLNLYSYIVTFHSAYYREFGCRDWWC